MNKRQREGGHFVGRVTTPRVCAAKKNQQKKMRIHLCRLCARCFKPAQRASFCAPAWVIDGGVRGGNWVESNAYRWHFQRR